MHKQWVCEERHDEAPAVKRRPNVLHTSIFGSFIISHIAIFNNIIEYFPHIVKDIRCVYIYIYIRLSPNWRVPFTGRVFLPVLTIRRLNVLHTTNTPVSFACDIAIAVDSQQSIGKQKNKQKVNCSHIPHISHGIVCIYSCTCPSCYSFSNGGYSRWETRLQSLDKSYNGMTLYCTAYRICPTSLHRQKK